MIRETYKLVKTVKKMYPVVQFLKDRYFPDGPVYYSEKALIEFKKKGRKIAPFVIPLVNGIVMEKDGYRTDIVDAPYIAPKRVITAKELEQKAFGESPESGRSPEQRENELESEFIDDNRISILRRHEKMCADILLTGQVIMKHYATAEDAAKGENYDFKYLRFYEGEFKNKYKFTKKFKDMTTAEKIQEFYKMATVLRKRGVTQAVVGKEYDVVNKMVVIEDTGVLLDKVVVSENETTYKADDDYVASINSEGYLVIALTNDGAASSLQKLNISYAKLNPDGVTAEDIIGGVDENGVRSGIELLDEVFINTGVIPAIVTAPVFSKKKEVAAALEAKVRLIGSLHNAKAYVDIDSSESGAVNVFNVAKVKEKNVPQSELIDACWPMVNKNGNVLAFSSFAAALAQAVAAENGDIPDGIDNRELLVDGVCTEDGTPVKVIQGDANSYLNANGIITAIRLPEWKAWGNNTAMYPASKDPTKRWSKCVMMLNYLQNRFKTEYLSKVGRNAKVKFIKGIVDEYNASLNALVPDYLAGGEIIFDTAKNPPSSMLEGHYIFSTRYADYTPAEYIENDFVYDAQILTDTMEGGDE